MLGPFWAYNIKGRMESFQNQDLAEHQMVNGLGLIAPDPAMELCLTGQETLFLFMMIWAV